MLTYFSSLPFPSLCPRPSFTRAYVNCTKSFLELHKYGNFVYFGISCYILYSVNLCNLKYICGISDEMQRGTVIKKNLWFLCLWRYDCEFLWRCDLRSIIKSSVLNRTHRIWIFFRIFKAWLYFVREIMRIDISRNYNLMTSTASRISQSCVYRCKLDHRGIYSWWRCILSNGFIAPLFRGVLPSSR